MPMVMLGSKLYGKRRGDRTETRWITNVKGGLTRKGFRNWREKREDIVEFTTVHRIKIKNF